MKKDTRIKQWLWATLTLGIATIALDRVLFPPAPVASWLVGETRGTEPYASVDPETPIALDLSLPEKSWVYAVSYDLDRGIIALFPSTSLMADQRQNPVPAGNHRLPGKHQGNELSWHSGDMPGAIEFLVVVSDHPLAELESEMGKFRQMGNAAFPLRTMLGTYAPKDGMKVVPGRHELPSTALKAARALEDPQNDGSFLAWEGHPGVFIKNMRVQNIRISHTAKLPAADRVEALNQTFLKASQATGTKPNPKTVEVPAAPPTGK